jgi:hypothetical protein
MPWKRIVVRRIAGALICAVAALGIVSTLIA